MNGVEIAAVLAAVLIAGLGLILDRRDKRKAAENEIKIIPDNPTALQRFRDRMRDKKGFRDIQP